LENTVVDDSLNKRLNYEYPFFEDMVEPHGALTINKECHACFYYAMLAYKARGNAGPIETQIIEYKVGEAIPLWREQRDSEIAQSVAIIYGLESPDKFLIYKKRAWAQGNLLGINFPEEIFRVAPKAQGLIH
jgi:hypothetical protein